MLEFCTRRTLPCGISLLMLGALLAQPAMASCHDGSPLILDLNDDGIHTTDFYQAVLFDINGDGKLEDIAWTNPSTYEAFLFLDLNHNGRCDNGLELFGNATLMPDGQHARHGFEALGVYDTLDFGGNVDGRISRQDLVWRHLRLWVDANHDGVSQRHEISRIGQQQVVAIDLDFAASDEIDGNLNTHPYQSTFVRRYRNPGLPPVLVRQAVHDVFFLLSQLN